MTDHPMAGGLGALAVRRAEEFDGCGEDRHAAGLARELKATLDCLSGWRPRFGLGREPLGGLAGLDLSTQVPWSDEEG